MKMDDLCSGVALLHGSAIGELGLAGIGRTSPFQSGSAHAFQGQRRRSPPYPEAEADGDQLVGVRCQLAAARQLDGLVHRRGDCRLAGGAEDNPWRTASAFAAGDPDRSDAQGRVSAGPAPDGRVDRLYHRPSWPTLAVPDHSTLSRRAATLEVLLPQSSARVDGRPMHLLVDSTGLKLCGAGEWLVEKHGTKTRRSWRKLHIGMDANTGEIVAVAVTTNDVDDASQVGPLLDQLDAPLASFTGDGAYDQDSLYRAITERHADALVIVPPRATAVPSETAETDPTQRDQHLQDIAAKGRIAWQKSSGYTTRSRVETTIGRYKQIIGDGLRFHKDERRGTEIRVAVHVLNRMSKPGRPISVRIA